jgi:hypothetical protein
MSPTISKTIRAFIIGAGAFGLAIGAVAQDTNPAAEATNPSAHSTTTAERVPAGEPKVTTSQLKGEVVSVGQNTLVAKMIPDGENRVFNIAPGKKFLIDGKEKTLAELKPGTVLTADVTTTETPLADRTTTVTKGKVLFSTPNSIILELPNGETKQYAVSPGFRADVGGEKMTATQLRRGMEVTGTKVVEEPVNSISQDAVVTGTAPK